MSRHGGALWARHPHVRSGKDLSFGERAADKLKATFGSWAFLIVLNAFILGWIALNVILPHSSRWDVYPFILLNLGLSWLAAQQGGALQIAANRGDRISAEVATGTAANTEAIKALLTENTDLTRLVKANTDLLNEIHEHLTAITPQAGSFPPAPPGGAP